MLSPQDFFDLSHAEHAAAFRNAHYVWEVLNGLKDYIQAALQSNYPPGIDPTATVHPSAVINSEQVHIGAGAVIAPQCYIEGPAIISAGASVGQGAYVRAEVVLSPGALLGHASEAKNALFLENAHAPHFAYVGDSLLGARVNLGAGTKLSNLAVNSHKDPHSGQRPSIMIRVGEQTYDTGLAKLGAILGDDVQCGCNTVTNPGTLIGPRTLVYALALVRKGYYPPDSLLKVAQSQELVRRYS
jgi:NDP-sugar pyrophosphorylase family protein